MRRTLIFVAAVLALGACKPTEPAPKPTPSPTPSAIYPRPDCAAKTLAGIEKRVCENKSLDWLDRLLHGQWEEARYQAPASKLKEIDGAQAKFLVEREACKDDLCIAKVYKSYISPDAKPAPVKKPPVKKPPVKKPPVKKPPVVRPAPAPRGPSCASTIGLSGAQQLARQCSRVNPGSCSPERSCGALRGAIRRGCNETYRKPDFCSRY